MRSLPAAIVLLLAVPALASLYEPTEANIVPVKPDGAAEPLAFDEFQTRFVALANIANPKPTERGEPNRDRERVLDRVKAFRKGGSADELAAHGADLLRVSGGDPVYLDKAIDLLMPHTRDRNPNYFLLMTLVHVHLARGDVRQAAMLHDDVYSLFELKLPATVKGWSPQQRNWIEAVDRDWLGHYLQIRLAEKELPLPPDRDEPTPLFPLPVKGQSASPLRFVNEAGEYEPGNLAPAERAKLPPDAIAIVQQLLLWFPSDTRLYWLLAELYAADGRLTEADTIFYQCTWGRQFGNRRLLMEHKGVLLAAIEARRKAEEQAQLDAYPINLKVVWYYFAAVVLVAAVAFVRSRTKRAGGSRPCCGG
ncbi:MAG: hypothetical protein U0791_12560 [Gemmataceae bacterium]